MKLTERTVVKPSHPQYQDMRQVCRLAKNLYNASLYDVRQHFFSTGKYKTWQTQRTEFAGQHPDYTALPAKVAGEVVKSVGRNFSSFFALLKKKQEGKYAGKVSIPRYRPQDGYSTVTFPRDTLSRSVERKGKLYHYTVCPRSFAFTFLSTHDNVIMIRLVPKNGYIVVECVYDVADVDTKPDNGRYAAIDLGIDILAALTTNTGDAPRLYNGKVIKSINQYYNKRKAFLCSQLGKEVKTSARIQRLTHKRENKIDWIMHNISSDIVNYLVSTHINTLVIGYNKGWKQNINIGKANNQKFTIVPFRKFINILTYKCELAGIRVVLTEESYTSKCSFLDKEPVCKHDTYKGRRVKRGIFKSATTIINADVNGSFNIMRKVVPDTSVYVKGVEDGAVHPVLVNIH